MRFTVSAADLARIVNAMFPGGKIDLDAYDDDAWFYTIVRIETGPDSVTFLGPYGPLKAAAQVESRGVAFIPIRDFVETGKGATRDEAEVTYDANEDRVHCGEHRQMLCQPWEFAVFDDPATAPSDWQSEGEPTEDEWEEA